MIVLAECGGSVSVGAGLMAARSLGRAYVVPDPLTNASAVISVDTTVGAAALPFFQQIVGFKVFVNGAEVDPKWILSWQVDEFLDRPATWSLALACRRDWPTVELDPIGNPGTLAAPPPGAREVSIHGVYVTATGAHEVPLLSSGQVDNGPRSGGVDALSGVDATGRYDRLLATLSLPAGHGLSRGAVLRRIFLDAGIPGAAMSLPSLSPMYKAVDLAEQPALAFGFELGRVEGYAPRATRGGVLTLERYYRPESGTPTWTLDEERYLSGQSGGEASYSPPGSDVPTRITLSTSAQVIREECERRVEKRVNLHFEVFAYRAAAYRQNSVGALVALTGDTPVSSLQLRRRITTLTEYDCETVVGERVITEEPYRPVAAKAILDDAADPAGPPQVGSWRDGVFVDADAVAEDDSVAYLWPHDRFTVVSDVTTQHVYGNENGLEGAVKTGELRSEKGWANPKAALKSRISASTQAWDVIAYESARFILHDLSGTYQANETFQVVATSEKVFSTTEDGAFYIAEKTTHSTISVGEGSLHLYAGGAKNAPNETLRPSSVDTIDYVPSGDSVHRALTAHSDLLGGGGSTFRDEPRDGHLPAAEIREDIDPPAALFDTEEEAANARGASRYDSQPLECTVDSPLLESTRQVNHVPKSEVWPETHDELCAMALQELREGSTGRISITLPANYLIQPGHRIRWVSRLNNLDLIGIVDHVSSGQSGFGAPILTAVEAKVYTI